MSEWMLDDLQETLDPMEDENGVVKVRKHITVVIHKKVTADVPPSSGNLGDTRSAIIYQVGGLWRTNNPAGTGKFKCIGFGIAPVEHPSDFVYWRETWDYIGPWTDPPPEWGV